MNLADWIDTATIPPRPLPPTVEAALAYLVEALGHPVYAHWTLARVKRRYERRVTPHPSRRGRGRQLID